MVYAFVKRSVDLIGATLGLILFSPLLLLTAVLIKLTSPGPVFVEHSDRLGRKGKVFRMLKFRTMLKNSHQLIRTDPKYSKLLEEYKKNSFKLNQDPRVTALGRFLRRASIDELPQLINVVKNDMSLIGPRAYYPDELAEQKRKFPHCNSFIETALKVKPGMTGLWQVSGRSEILFEKRIEMDAAYTEKKSLWLDFVILLKTPIAVLKGEGKTAK